MATSNNILQVTSKGLKDCCKELINKRTFDGTKIEKIGNPNERDGIASLLSENDYYTYSNLTFSNYNKNSIEFSGVYVASSDVIYQTAWNLSESITPSNNMSLRIFNNKIALYKENLELLSIVDINITNESYLNISVTFDEKKVTLFSIIGKEVYSVSTTFSNIVNLEDFDSVSIGNNNPGNLYYWHGTINLAAFGILKDGSLYYSPSFKNNLKFTKILIGDGIYPLNDNSVPIVNHVYEFPVLEVNRSNNSILLSAQIGSDSYLNIKELGLYISSEEGTRLFSLVNDLAIRKEKNLGYSLIFNVKLDVNVINTNMFPEIILMEEEISNFESFNTIRMSYTNLEIDLERIIKKNSEELGRNLVQHLYRQKRNLDLIKDNWNAVDSFNKICNKFKYAETKTFSLDNVEKEGNISISEKGEASGFSNTSYIKAKSVLSNFSTFEANIPFTTSNNISNEQVIFESSDGGRFAPFKIYINNQKCYVEGSERRKITTEENEYLKSTLQNKDISGVTYYAWSNESNVVYSLNKFPSVGDELYKIDSSGPSIITETVKSLADNQIFSNSINIKTNTKYILKTTFDGYIYKFYLSEDDGEFVEVSNFIINKIIEPGEAYFFGIGSSLTNPFLGSMNLLGYEVISSSDKSCFYEVQVFDALLNEFIHIPKTFLHFFKAVDLKDKNYYFEILDNEATSSMDKIDFSKDNSLCLKLDFKNVEDKVVFAKTRKEDSSSPEFYLKIYLENYNLHIEINSSTESIHVVKNYGIKKISKLTSNPVTIFIINKGNSFSIYLNNELIARPGLSEHFDLDSGDYYVTSSYLKDMVNLSGAITENDIFYLNNILDTNFGDSKFITTSDGTYEAKFYNTNEIQIRNTVTYYVWECENQSYTYPRILLLDKEPSTLSSIYDMDYEPLTNLHIISF